VYSYLLSVLSNFTQYVEYLVTRDPDADPTPKAVGALTGFLANRCAMFPASWEAEPIAIDDNAVRKIDGVDR
jgi:hypothetical protein